ncbi:C-type lectin domain family 2 member D-like [Rana temporaria]|uniref:C-type lectin domain family 2 member D-like n=1 Tax=Rana temporaria TaxID=8407 RepID=UPI001AADC2C7|nr:C-type lectin domain family 2 member D-like [Rana temporaria]
MRIGERQPESDAKAAEEGCLAPLTNKDSEKSADNPKEGFWQKLRSSTVTLRYVVVGAPILVTVIIILIILTARSSVRASAESDEVLTFLEKSTGETTETKVVEVRCEDDWILYRGKFYYISDQIATWTDSQNFCKSHDSSLAIIHNAKEKNFLNLLNSNNYWIGLSRTQDDSGWVWNDGTFYSKTIFDIHRRPVSPGESENVYLNGDGFKSDSGRYPKKWICSKSFLGHSP